MATSKMQRAFAQAVYFRFDNRIIHENHRPSWLLNDTGDRLELDFWFPEIAIAIEVQGQQHYQYTPHFHADYKAFETQVRHNELKQQICEGFSIRLLEVYDQITFEFAVDAIESAFKALETKPQEKPRQYWLQYMGQTFRDLDELYRKRPNMVFGKYASRLSQIKTKLQGYLHVYGIQVFEETDTELAQKMFHALLRNMNWYTAKKRQKRFDKSTAYKNNGGAK